MSFLDNLNWRFATKKFDSNKQVSQDDLKKIMEAIRLTPTSYGLQSLHVYFVTDKILREQIKTAAFNQPQITDAYGIFIFCANLQAAERVYDYLKINQQINNLTDEQIKARGDYMLTSINQKNPTEIENWAAKQTYIALGFALAACAELKIDSCPMEGFDKETMNQVLNLPPHLKSTVILPIGYRAEDSTYKKVRFPESDLFTNL